MKRLLIFMIPALALLAGCNRDGFYEPGGPDSGNEFLTVNYTVDGLDKNTATRAQLPAEEGEMEVHSLYFLFFEMTSGRTGSFLTYIKADIPDGEPWSNSHTVAVRFPEGSGLTNSASYNILAVANMHKYLADGDVERWLDGLAGRIEDDVINETVIQSRYALDPLLGVVASETLLMSARAVKPAQMENVDFVLTRGVSRIDVYNYDTGYTLLGAEIWNAFPRTTVWESSFNDFSIERVKSFYGVESEDGDPVKGKLYAFENLSTTPVQGDEVTTCVIVGLKNNTTGAIKYYRVNINPNGHAQSLKRNYVYSVKINNVLTEGADNKEDAYTGRELNLDVSINQWDVAEDGTLLMDSENVLVLPTTKMIFPPQGGEYIFNVYVEGPGELEISKQALPPHMNALLTGTGKTLKVICGPSDSDEQGAFELRIGALKGTITVVQTGATTEYLNLSEDDIPGFSASNISTYPGRVSVSSSGPWKAKIYNGQFNGLDVFSFHTGPDYGQVTVEITGDDGDDFGLTTLQPNPGEDERHAFVMVSLDSDPSIKRVLLLTQLGVSRFAISPKQNDIEFTPMGDVRNGSNNVFNVSPGAGEQWAVQIQPATMAANFRVSYYDAGGNFSANPISGNGSFKVEAIGPNFSGASYNPLLRVYYTGNASVEEYMDIVQPSASWTLPADQTIAARIYNNTGFRQLPVRTNELAVSSTSLSASEGYHYRATIRNVTLDGLGLSAYGYDTDIHKTGTVFDGGQTTITRPMGSTFTIQVPYIPFALITARVEVYVEVVDQGGVPLGINGTFYVNQSALELKNIQVTPQKDGYGSLQASSNDLRSRIMQMRINLLNTDYFGPSNSAYVYSAGVTLNGHQVPPTNSIDIYQLVVSLSSEANGNSVKTWHQGSDARVLMVTAHESGEALTMARNSGLYDKGYTAFSNSARSTNHKIVNTGSVATSTKLWNYLMKEGPATNGVEITPYLRPSIDETYVSLTSWPDTFIPILFNDAAMAYCSFGIDPTNRVVFIGDTEIFSGHNTAGNYQPGVANNNYNDPGSDNNKFLNNVISYMLNVAQYGDDFNEPFKQKGR